MRNDDWGLATGDWREPLATEVGISQRADPPVPSLQSPVDSCDYCGAEALTWRKCKLICEQCGNIVKSCADL